MFDLAISGLAKSGGNSLPGEEAFLLHDTYGFPIDLTLEMAAEQGVAVDEGGFRRLMAEQRARAKADGHGEKGWARRPVGLPGGARVGGSDFTGYREISRESLVTALVGPDGLLAAAGAGDEVLVVLDATPFYAEGGGQQSDWGRITINAPDHNRRTVGARRSVAAARPDRASRPGTQRAEGPSRRHRPGRGRREPPPFGFRGVIRRRTCCTGRCVATWARRPRKRGR